MESDAHDTTTSPSPFGWRSPQCALLPAPSAPTQLPNSTQLPLSFRGTGRFRPCQAWALHAPPDRLIPRSFLVACPSALTQLPPAPHMPPQLLRSFHSASSQPLLIFPPAVAPLLCDRRGGRFKPWQARAPHAPTGSCALGARHSRHLDGGFDGFAGRGGERYCEGWDGRGWHGGHGACATSGWIREVSSVSLW